MATVAVTCIKNGRTDIFGRPLIAGTNYPEIDIDVARALWLAGFVSVADTSVFSAAPSLVSELSAIGAPLTYKFPGFATGRLLASLVAGSTATRAGLTVTVTATAHGIPSGKFAGRYFFFPGCASLAAGWYPGFLYVSANSVQFSLPVGTAGADFAGESVNGGAAHLAQTRVLSLSLPPNALQSGSKCTLAFFRRASTGGSTKFTYFFIDSDQMGRIAGSASPTGFTEITVACDGPDMVGLTNGNDAINGNATTEVAKDYSLPISCHIDSSIGAAGEYSEIAIAVVTVTK